MITFDFETKSYADLQKVGAWVYSEHYTTEIICCAYGIDDQPIQTWWPGKKLEGVQAWGTDSPEREMPKDLYMALMMGHEIEAHNVSFERSIWTNICVPEFNWIEVCNHQWVDLMAAAAYYAMPPSLEKLANAIGYQGKNPEGTRLISKYSKLHLKTAKEEIPDEDFEKFVKYCVDDVILEQACSDYLGDIPDYEKEIFQLDQEINLRGIYLDEKSIRDAAAVVEKRSKELADRFRKITGLNPTQHDKVKAWLEDHGCPMENLQAEYIEEVLDGKHDFTPKGDALEALGLRMHYNKASTKKLDAMLRQRSSNGRAIFQSRYHGAQTGRWTGTGFQPLNLARSYEEVPPDRLIRDIAHRDPEFLDMMYGDAMEAIGKASRHHIIAEEGNEIMAGDFVSIEAVVLSCLAGEDWKVEAFRNKEPIYELMGCMIHDLPEEAIELARRNKSAFKDQYPAERFDGKTGELAFGYQGALGAWLKFDNSGRHSEETIIANCRAWRERHPNIKAMWYAMEEAAIDAVATPGKMTGYRDIGFEVVDEWLSMILPNGKRIWYYQPQLREAMPAWHQPSKKKECENGTCRCEPRPQLSYMAQKEGRWHRVTTYGGKLTENATQATSREILVPAMKRLKKYNYPIILSVYDEIVCEVPKNSKDVREFEELMMEPAGDWADYYPVSVDAWIGDRYKK